MSDTTSFSCGVTAQCLSGGELGRISFRVVMKFSGGSTWPRSHSFSARDIPRMVSTGTWGVVSSN